MNGGMIVPGTFAKCQRVREVVAIRGKADVARTSRFCCEGPEPDVDWAEVELKELVGLIPRNAINADSTAQIATAGPSLANALFFDFTDNQMRTLASAAGLGTYPISGSMSQRDDVG